MYIYYMYPIMFIISIMFCAQPSTVVENGWWRVSYNVCVGPVLIYVYMCPIKFIMFCAQHSTLAGGVCPIMFVWVQGVSGSTVGANY